MFYNVCYNSRETGTAAHAHGEDSTAAAIPDEEPFTRINIGHPEARDKASPGTPVMRRSDSPEIPYQTPPRNESLDSTTGSSFVGLRVVAKWSSNGYFYSGTITRDVGGGKYKLLFDDGYECDVLGKDILLCDPIPLDTEVTALSEDEYFSAGMYSIINTCYNVIQIRHWRRRFFMNAARGFLTSKMRLTS